MNSIEQITYNLAEHRLKSWFKNNKDNTLTKNHLDIIFPYHRPIHSIIQSLLTSFGSFWEQLAEAIALNNNYDVRKKVEFNNNVPLIPNDLLIFKNSINQKILQNSLNIEEGIYEIKSFIKKNNFDNKERSKIDSGKGIDIWFEKGGEELIGDMKSPQENIGNAKKLIDHMLIWSTTRLLDNPNASLKTAIIVPYNPFPDFEIYEKIQGNKMKPLQTGLHILIADYFWDHISNQKNTTKLIFSTLNKIRSSDVVKEIEKLMEVK